MRLKVETGSQVNIMPLKELKTIEGDNPQMDLCNQKLVSCSENNLKVLGIIKLPVKSKPGIEQEVTFHVVETNQQGFLEETATNGSSLTTRTSQELKEGCFRIMHKSLLDWGV